MRRLRVERKYIYLFFLLFTIGCLTSGVFLTLLIVGEIQLATFPYGALIGLTLCLVALKILSRRDILFARGIYDVDYDFSSLRRLFEEED